MEIEYQRNWCDYLTDCPNGKKDVKVGSYECFRCEHWSKSSEEPPKAFRKCDYSRYFNVTKGVVTCKFDKQE